MSIGGQAVPLSRREREIAALVAEGLTDREIGRRLFISTRTVEGHVQQIRNKLGLDNRTQIASWMTSRTLLGGHASEAPARSEARPPDNLPAQLTTFVGRERDLDSIRQLLRRARLVTITGPGGCGKTRLAVQAASEVLLQYPGGAWFIGLGSVSDPAAVPREVAAALGIEDREGSAPLEAVAAGLAARSRRRRALVVLDNCEHLARHCAATVAALLRASPDVTFLCTSREPLHVSGEATWKVGPLSLPEPGEPPSPELATRSEAVRLFVDRVRLRDPDFALDELTTAGVVALCRRLDGIPLALELAAARVGLMPLGQIAGHLERRIPTLYPRDAPSRQHTVTATIDWSHELLNEVERQVFRRLAVFRGSFTLEAAEALCHDVPAGDALDTLDVLTLLVDKSLAHYVSPQHERYRCLELIRRYAWDRLTEGAELDAMLARHHAFYFGLAERAAPELTGSMQAQWLQRLGDDHDNLRAALEFARHESPEHRLRFALALHRFWRVRGHLGEGRAWTEQALEASAAEPTPLRAQALSVAAGLAWQQGDLVRSRAWLERCLAAWRALGDRPGIQYSLGNLGLIAWKQGDSVAARAWYEESLELSRELGNERETAVVLCNLGLLLAHVGETEDGEAHLREALEIMRGLGDLAAVAIVLANLGTAALLGGRDPEASERYRESLGVQRSLGARENLAECVEGLASVAARGGRHERALRLAGAAEGIRDSMGAAPDPSSERLLQWVDRAREAAGADAERWWREGRALAEADGIALALEE
ncbi:MAG TPA: tetratricopeptide repeat protein [Candidatus Dormibacteraeota bacterium]